MTVQELIDQLSILDPTLEMMALNSSCRLEHFNTLVEIAYCDEKNKVASSGDECQKIALIWL